MSPFILLLLFELLGILLAIYLIWKRKKKESPVCLLGEDCNAVLGSKYNSVLGIHNDVMGLFYYIAMITIVLMLRYDVQIISPDLLYFAMKAIAALGAVMAAIFMFIQWQVLEKWCFWCIASNFNTWIIAFIIFGIL